MERELEYDAAGRKVGDNVDASWAGPGPRGLSWEYDALGRLVAAGSKDSVGQTVNEVRYSYDPWGRPLSVCQGYNYPVGVWTLSPPPKSLPVCAASSVEE